MTVANATSIPPSRVRSAHATLWALADLAGGQGASFLIFLVLARVIGPEQYGAFAIAMSLLALLTIVQNYGFADAIVQRAQIDDSFLDTVFWCDVVLAICLVSVAQLGAAPAASVFAVPVLEPMIRALSVLCLLQALVTVPTALCRRALKMQILAARTLLSYAAGGIVGIVLALRGYGVWALVLSQITQYVVILFVMYWRFPWRPGLCARSAGLPELMHFAGHFMVANGLKLSTDRMSQLVVGLFVDAAGVGYYAMALRIMLTASALAISPIERVALPVLSRFAHDLPAYRQTYRRMVLIVNSVWTPVATGLGVSAPVLLPMLFGERWAPAAPVLQAMCFTAPTFGLWFLNGQALAAIGQPERYTRLAIAYVALACIAFPISAQFGIVAAGAAWAVVSLLMVPLHLIAMRRASGLSPASILSDWLRVTVSAVLMLIVALVIDHWLKASLASRILGLAAGTVAYLLLLELVLLPGYVGRLLSLLRYAASPGRPATPEEAV
jgi:O-antigen/teichoic acid export membrane protein